jgi:hypothetical protein
VAQSKTYLATIEPSGLKFFPHKVASDRNLGGSAEGVHRLEPDLACGVSISTQSIKVGGATVYMKTEDEPSIVLGNTSQKLLNGPMGILEHFEARSEGVELTWVIPSRPSHPGPLVISTSLSGLTFHTNDESGLLFADSAQLPRLLVGKPLLIDAKGVEIAARIKETVNGFEITISEATLASVAYPMAIDPTISSSFPVGIAIATAAQGDPEVACVGTTSLVVWHDSRNGTFDIYGTRVNASGDILDPTGIAISTATGDQKFPTVTSNSTGYFVAWADARNSDSDIYGCRVSSSGVVSDTAGIAITTAINSQNNVQVASDGSDYFAVWSDFRGAMNYNVYGTRIRASDGVLLDSTGMALTTSSANEYRPDIAWNGAHYFVV